MRQLANMRPASKAMGDDISLTRWVKLPGRHQSKRTTAPMAETATGTRFASRVLEPGENPLTSAHNNVKIGRDVRKGHLRGYWIYTLSLEERATCPRSCAHWTDCYGNSMPLAKRLRHGPELEAALEAQLDRLLSIRGRRGVLVRLHALGDFYSVEYVDFWRRMLAKHRRLSVFGYTARAPGTPIGDAIFYLGHAQPRRFAMRWSDGNRDWGATVSIMREEDRPPNAFVCPEQTGKTQCCATCAACWSTTKNVAFLGH